MEDLEKLKSEIKHEVKEELRNEFKKKMYVAIGVVVVYAAIVLIQRML